MVAFLCIVVPHTVVILTELFRHFFLRKKRSYTHRKSSGTLKTLYIYLGTFWFTFGLTHMVLNVAKETAGQLRPHFFQACQPVMPGNTTCADAVNQNRFITDYECTGSGTLNIMTDMGQSFPSSHAAHIFFAMIWLTFYIHRRWSIRQFSLLKVLVQFLFLLLAWYVSMTRLRDYFHHFVDVATGCFIGVFMALISTKCIFRKHFSCPKTEHSEDDLELPM